ncbi:MAG: tetratricopeptide repeat protein, partial [Pyrinomonadaceae bacterium]|nr:tetratricopeptide repeat protein [Pyrinomonadaceae bacterium]
MIRQINQSSKVCRRGQRTGVRRNTALILSLLLLWAMMPARFLSTVAQPRASSNPTVQNEEKITTLELGQLIERELTENETHIYQIHLTSGQFLRVVVDQRGIDVAVALFAPDGQMMTEVASPNGTQGLEPISVVTKMSGGYRLEVRSLEKTAAGCYEVKVEALREATMQDKAEALAVALAAAKTEEERAGLLTQEKQLVTATLPQTLNNQGKQLESQGNYAQALALFFLALNIAERINDKAESAAIFNNIGLVYAAQGNYAQAMKYYQESLTLSEAQGLKTDVARALGNIGRVHSNQGNYAQAMEYYQKSLTLSEESGDKEGIARVLGSIGVVHRAQSNYAEALEYYQKSLALSVEIGDRWRIATILGNIGYVHHLQGNYAAALEHYQKNLKLNEEFGNRWGIATALGNIGDVYLLQGNYDEAMQYARQSLELNEKLGIKGGISRALNIISLLYLRQRNYTQALEYFHKSLALLEEIGHKSAIADTMSNIGTVYSAQGNLTQAMDYYQKSLTLREELGNKLGITFSLRNLGNIYMAQGNYVLALKFYQQCLHLNEEIGNKSGIVEALKGLGNIYERQGNHRQALEFVERAAAIARQINSRELLREARIIAGISYRALQQSVQSRRAFEEAIAVTEALRSNIAGQEARASFFATVQQPYELYIDLLMQQHKEHPSAGHDALALQMNERVRARTLLEALSEARADIRQGIDPVLRVRATTLQQQLNARAEHQTRLLSGKYTAEQAAALKKEINALTAEYQDVQAQIRRHSPRYAALTQPQPLTVRELQTGILDAETLLLEYALGEERSYVWAMTQTTLHSYELPKRAEIEDAVRGFYSLVSDNQRWRESAQASVQYRKASERLSQMLLVPIRSHLTSKRLVIVADGALQYVPFGALPAPSAQVSGVRDRVS